MPSTPGICRSITTTSGSSSSASSTASAPVAASPTTSTSSSDSAAARSPARNAGWSSAISRRRSRAHQSLQARAAARTHDVPPPRRAADRRMSRRLHGALAHRGRGRRPARSAGETRAVVVDLDLERAVDRDSRTVQAGARACRGGVGHRLLRRSAAPRPRPRRAARAAGRRLDRRTRRSAAARCVLATSRGSRRPARAGRASAGAGPYDEPPDVRRSRRWACVAHHARAGSTAHAGRGRAGCGRASSVSVERRQRRAEAVVQVAPQAAALLLARGDESAPASGARSVWKAPRNGRQGDLAAPAPRGRGARGGSAAAPRAAARSRPSAGTIAVAERDGRWRHGSRGPTHSAASSGARCRRRPDRGCDRRPRQRRRALAQDRRGAATGGARAVRSAFAGHAGSDPSVPRGRTVWRRAPAGDLNHVRHAAPLCSRVVVFGPASCGGRPASRGMCPE